MSLSVHFKVDALTLTSMGIFMFVFMWSSCSVSFLYAAEIGSDYAMSLAVFTNYIWTIVVSFTMPYILASPLGVPGTFGIFGALSTLGVVFMVAVIKETKGLSNDETLSLYSKK